MTLAIIALGSNINNPPEQLGKAYSALKELEKLSDLRASKVYLSPPMGPTNQPPFHNAAVAGSYTGEPLELLRSLQAIERQMGRIKRRHWGERCIDLDIIQLGDQIIRTPNLTVPHAGTPSRLFVIQPIIDILGPDHQVPLLGELGNLRSKLVDDTLKLCDHVSL